MLDDATANFVALRWLQLDFAAYTGANGTLHPAVGDLDGDGKAEIVAGLGPYSGVADGVGRRDDGERGAATDPDGSGAHG
ncbi:MAG TPA: hypothetical protein VFX12_03790 [Vicinamibacterales bacterium]|nr:hypothetical protein [Vicinamibacterales bacterium]